MLKEAKRQIIIKLCWTALMALLVLIIVVPFFWMISASFKKPIDIFKFPIDWIPNYFYLDNFKYIFTNSTYNFIRMYLNSIKITAIDVTGSLLIGILAAYGFSKIKFPFRDKLFLVYIATLIIPSQVLLIPRFIIFNKLGLMDSHAALIITGLFAVMNTFLLRQYFVQIPEEISESVRIDGGGHLTTCFRIIVPLAKPVITTFIIVVATVYWNDYENPLIFIRSKELMTLPLGLANFYLESTYDSLQYHYLMAGAAVSIVPMLIIFLLGQRYIIDGLVAGAVKG